MKIQLAVCQQIVNMTDSKKEDVFPRKPLWIFAFAVG